MSRQLTPQGMLVYSLGPYAGELSRRIAALKYHQETHWAAPLATELGGLLPPTWKKCRLIPVPLHPERLAERGFNQSALLACRMARLLSVRCDVGSLSRLRQTRAQARLGRRERFENVGNAFAARSVENDHEAPVVLIDDVVTTGRTLDACRAALLEAGHTVRGALAVARAEERVSTQAPCNQNTV